MYEGGVREPLLVRWPEVIKPGISSAEVVTSQDFYPTFLEAAGLDLIAGKVEMATNAKQVWILLLLTYLS